MATGEGPSNRAATGGSARTPTITPALLMAMASLALPTSATSRSTRVGASFMACGLPPSWEKPTTTPESLMSSAAPSPSDVAVPPANESASNPVRASMSPRR